MWGYVLLTKKCRNGSAVANETVSKKVIKEGQPCAQTSHYIKIKVCNLVLKHLLMLLMEYQDFSEYVKSCGEHYTWHRD